MENLRRQRAPVRAAFTRAANELEEGLAKEEPTLLTVRQRIAKLDLQRVRLVELDSRIQDFMLTNNDLVEEDLNEEYEVATEYQDRFIDNDARVRDLLEVREEAESVREAPATVRENLTSLQYKLPKLEFKKFSGEPKDWLSFWSQFKKIDSDAKMPPEEKFQYLVQATVEGSKAREEEQSVLTLYDKLETQLRALETLGVTRDKYASMLYPLVESCLPEEVLRIWERSRQNRGISKQDERLAGLIEFLKNEVDGEVRITMARSGLGFEADNKQKQKDKKPKEIVPTAAGLFNGNQNSDEKKLCVFCEKPHQSQDCFKAPKMTREDKTKILQDKKCCFCCLKVGHMASKCRAKPRCQVCTKKHFVIMCPDLKKPIDEKLSEKVEETKDVALANQSCSQDVILQTLLVRVHGRNFNGIARVLIDNGSQKSYISSRVAERLELSSVGTWKTAHSLFGGTETQAIMHQKYKLNLSSLDRRFSCVVEVLDQTVICGSIPVIQDSSIISELNQVGIIPSDLQCSSPEIHLLLGADVIGKLYTGKLHATKAGPVAMETKLGWTVMGKMDAVSPTFTSTALVASMIVTDSSITNLWKLETLGIMDPAERKSRMEIETAASDFFNKTLKREIDGRYIVSLPWLSDHPVLPSNEEIAVKRLHTTTKKLEAMNNFGGYQEVLDDWLAQGIIEEVPNKSIKTSSHYLPHRAVIKNSSSTTKIRPVFDASAKCKNSVSLNECLEKGENLLEQIPSVIAGFRSKRIGIVSDIEKAFLQLSLASEDSDFVRFLWWSKDKQEIKIYRHCRVVFGVCSSPFLLAATLKRHLNNVRPEDVPVAVKLLNSMYVDNCVTSLDDEDDVPSFINDSVRIMATGKFNLRDWVWSGQDRSSAEAVVHVLGLLWNVNDDSLGLDLSEIHILEDEMVTKRKMLSVAQHVFDPVGFGCPFSLIPKLLLQESWMSKVTWDNELPPSISERFQKWLRELECLKELKIPRYYFVNRRNDQEAKKSLHLFVNASNHAYAAVVFVREVFVGQASVQLVQAKARVAPLKKLTIPRSELMACCIGARLLANVKKDLGVPEIPAHCWTDSSNAWWWIRKNDSWNVFVRNRVKEIKDLTECESWRHVPGNKNPADLPSRGCSAKYLIESRWWEGPDWLFQDEDKWPKSNVVPDDDVINAEKAKTVAAHLSMDSFCWVSNGLTDFTAVVKRLALVLRYVQILQKRVRKGQSSPTINPGKAELVLWKVIQAKSFNESDQILKQLNVKKDMSGLWRVETKIIRRKDKKNFRFPILLSSHHVVVGLLIKKIHEQLSHAGVQVMMSKIREKFWIPKARKAIKQVLKRCIRCSRFNAKSVSVAPAALPIDRVQPAVCFQVTGVDMAGPLYLRSGEKSYVVIYTCAMYRAVHLELVSFLSTESFIQSFRRFIARRGRPSIVYSDNGLNFKGASTQLRNVNWEEIAKSSYGSSNVLQPINWKFNPPQAAWWGGWWERIIRMVKELLRRILGRSLLNYEELQTVLCDCEAILNSRPLTYVSEDSEDLVPLTPLLFLQDVRASDVPDLDCLDLFSINKRLRYRQKLKEDFRGRFRKEYLSLLVHRHRSKKSPVKVKVGDIVLVGADNAKRIDWPLGKILEVYTGQDGNVRVVKVKTQDGEITRPVQRIYPMEVSSEEGKNFK